MRVKEAVRRATAADPDGPAPVLDLETVRQLQSLPGRAGSLFLDLAPVFLRTCADQVGRLHEQLGAGDRELAGRTSFQLVSACRSFGARRMAATAAALHALVTEPGVAVEGATRALTLLEAEFATVVCSLEPLVATR